MHIRQWLRKMWFKLFIVCLILLTNLLFILWFVAFLFILFFPLMHRFTKLIYTFQLLRSVSFSFMTFFRSRPMPSDPRRRTIDKQTQKKAHMLMLAFASRHTRNRGFWLAGRASSMDKPELEPLFVSLTKNKLSQIVHNISNRQKDGRHKFSALCAASIMAHS